jgi:malate dehydrogenase (oxaloacetate-decarboxylating)
MKQAAARAIAEMVKNPTVDKIMPDPFEPGLTERVAQAVATEV